MNMNFRNAGIFGLLFAMLLSVSAFAQFQSKNDAFEAPGPGDPDRSYAFIVPEGATIETRDGQTITGGETVSVPGKYIELLAVEQAEQDHEAGIAFNSKSVKPEAQEKGLVMIALTIPEGVTVTGADGTVVTGETQIKMIVQQTAWEASEEMAEEPTAFNKK